MTPSDAPFDDHADQSAQANQAADERISAQLAGLRPVEPGPGLRSRIAAELPLPGADSFETLARRRRVPVGERLAWAAGGAVAASLVFLLGGVVPSGREQAPVAAVTAVDSVPAAAARPSQVRDEAVSWFDEGIRFVDEFTPARVLRRKVIERHVAGDGTAEVRVPREDVIFLPVALR